MPITDPDDATLALTRELIARQSVTPDDAGCQDAMVSRLATDPAWVYGELMDDARVHEDCDNWIKADVVRQTAARVTALM